MKVLAFLNVVLILWIEMGTIKCVSMNGGCVFVGTEVHCKYKNLTFIPELPTNVTALVFSGNFLPNITNSTFTNISNPERVLRLCLPNNTITTISEDSFDSFTRLAFLELSGNHIENVYLKRLLGVLCHRDFSLVLDSMGEHFTSESTFSLMNGCDLKQLYLRGNNLVNLSQNIIKHFDNIPALHFGHNRIKEFQLPYMKRLEMLSVKYNHLNHFPNFCTGNDSSTSLVPKIKTLFINNNRIFEFSSQTFQCLSSLITLDISKNYFIVFPDDMLLNLPNIRYLIIHHNTGQEAHIEKYAFRSKSLEQLTLTMTGGRKNSIFDSVNDTFKYLPNMKYLTLAYISMRELPTASLYGLFAPLDKLEHFTCYVCKLERDPSIILDNKDKLTLINMGHDRIDKVNNTSVSSKQFLKYLIFKRNKLTYLSSTAFPVNLLNRLELVDFSGNPFACDCALGWFIDWLKTANRSKIKHLERYKCASPQKYVGKLLLDIEFSYLECHPLKTWVWVTIGSLPTFLMILVIAISLYRNRWNIKHFIYLFRKRKNYVPIEGSNFVYDAFVSYNHKDSDLVIKRLIPTLENESNYKLCVHERDFPLGAYISDNIVQRIEESKRMILVLSDAFATSGWCMFELKLALSKHIEEEFEVIVILLHAVKINNMDKSIKTLLEVTTYLEWTEDDVGTDLFWHKLRNAMSIESKNDARL